MTRTEDIFKISTDDKIICPPELVFSRTDFEFLLSPGGHLVEDAHQYIKLIKTLNGIGETEIYLRENLGATETDRVTPFELKISVKSTLHEFNAQTKNSIDKHFGLTPWHWYIHGNNPDWGIYLAEYPTILIIGCTENLLNGFKQTFGILGNGLNDVEDILINDLRLSKDLDAFERFKINYRLKSNARK